MQLTNSLLSHISKHKLLWAVPLLAIALLGGFTDWVIQTQISKADFQPVAQSCNRTPWSLAFYNGYKTLDAVALKSDLVIKGKVVNRRVVTDQYRDKSQSWAVHDIEIIEIFKGNSNNPIITVGKDIDCLNLDSTYYLFLQASNNGKAVEYRDLPDKYQNPASYIPLSPQGEFLVLNSRIQPRSESGSGSMEAQYRGIEDSEFVIEIQRVTQPEIPTP